MIIQGFKPVIDQHSHILILGSMPSEESLRRQEYYANPRNQFWQIIEILFSPENREDEFEQSDYARGDISYAQKLEFILSNQLALWDVIAACEREGSLDSNIRSPEPNEFAELFTQYPNLRFVAFNGQKAFDIYRRKVGLDLKEGVIYQPLPSTSPANTMSLERKVDEWKILKDWLNRDGKF